MIMPKNIVGKKFLTKTGRFGKVIATFYSRDNKKYKYYSIRSVGKNKLRNLYRYTVAEKYLKNKVIAWFNDNEIKFMYKKIFHYNEDYEEVRLATDGVKHRREERWL